MKGCVRVRRWGQGTERKTGEKEGGRGAQREGEGE